MFANIIRADNGSRLNFNGTLGYLDAQYDEFITNIPAGFADDGTTNLAQTTARPVDVADFRRIQNTPKWTLSGTLNYSTPLAGGTFDIGTTLSWRSKTNQFEVPSPFLDQPGYALWDGNLTWTSSNDRYTIGLHAKNILDKQYITSGYQFLAVNPVTGVPLVNAVTGNVIPSLGREGVVTVFYGNPRQIFLSFGLKL